MSQSDDPTERDAVREIIARYAAKFPIAEVTELAIRLVRSEHTTNSWEHVLAEIVACAIYNDIGIAEAERLALGCSEDSNAV